MANHIGLNYFRLTFGIFYLLLDCQVSLGSELEFDASRVQLVNPTAYTSMANNGRDVKKSFYSQGHVIRLTLGETGLVGILVKSSFDEDSFSVKKKLLPSNELDNFSINYIDIKVVKKWYQANNKTVNPRADGKRYSVYELLLNDERLVKVDVENKDNYLRIDNGFIC